MSESIEISPRISAGDYTSTIYNVPYGTTFTARIASTNTAYNPGTLNITSGTVTGDVTVQASDAQIKRYTITIQQSANQTIHVYANGGDYTSSVTLNHGTTWTASVIANSGYKAGTLNISSGTLTGNITINATAAIQTYQFMNNVAEFHMASHLRYYYGADDNHGSLSPLSPLNTFVVIYNTNRYNTEHADRVVFRDAWFVFNVSSEYQSKFNSCNRINFTVENFPIVTNYNNFTIGTINFHVEKSWLEWHDSSDDYWHESVVGWGCCLQFNADESSEDVSYDIGLTSSPSGFISGWRILYNGLTHCHQEGIGNIRISTNFV